ncbi:MAG: hypothetical protein MHMPM18_000750 [Marteilia pararefringens]
MQVNSKSEQHERQQRKTFTKYASNLLVSNGFGPINDIVDDLWDGLKLIELMNCLRNKKKGPNAAKTYIEAPEKNPKNVFQRVSNCNTAIQRVRDDNVVLINIDGESIERKRVKLNLGLIWTLICAYNADGGGESITKAILDYVNKILNAHQATFNVGPIDSLLDITIIDGRVIKVMNYHYLDDARRRNLTHFESDPSDKIKHFDEGMTDANSMLNIPIFLEGKDMESIDAKSVTTQLLMYKELEASMSQEHMLKDKLRAKISKKQEAREKARRLDSMANDLIDWITNRTSELSDLPDDAMPEVIDSKSEFVNNHFKADKPPKADEYAKILGEVSKFKFECETNDLIAPPVRSAALNSAWKQMMASEKLLLERLAKMKSVYTKVLTLLREFERLVGATQHQINALESSLGNYHETAKATNISNLPDLEIYNNTLKSDEVDLKDDLEHIRKYVSENITPICPCKEFEAQKFHSKLDSLQSSASSCKSQVEQCDSVYRDAQQRCEKSRELLKQMARKSKRMNSKLADLRTFCDQVKPYDSLEEFEASSGKASSFNLDSINQLSQEIQDLARQNAEILNISESERQINPYTQLVLQDLMADFESLKPKFDAKLDYDKSEKERLDKRRVVVQKISEAIDNLNNDIDAINVKVEAFNESSSSSNGQDYDSSIKKLEEMKNSLLEIQPALDRISKTISDTPELNTDVLMVNSKLGSSVESINNYIAGINQAKNSKDVGEDMSLTKAELKEIEKTFNTCDSEKQKKLPFDDFFTCVVTTPLMGVKKIDRTSKELSSLFKQYSADGTFITLDSLKNLYTDCKRNFTLNSKDAVTKMLTSAADQEGYVSREKLVDLLGSDYFQTIESNLTAVDKSGSPHYALNEIL